MIGETPPDVAGRNPRYREHYRGDGEVDGRTKIFTETRLDNQDCKTQKQARPEPPVYRLE